MKVLVYGAGYVGLSMAVVLSQVHQVTVVDIKKDIVRKINNGESPVNERGIENLLQSSVKNGKLVAVNKIESPFPVDAILICVNTPPGDDGSADLSQVNAVMQSIVTCIDEFTDQYLVIALRSTVPPGTTRNAILEKVREYENIGVVFSPEFLRQGSAIDDIRKPDRVVIGGSDERASSFYEKLLIPCLTKTDSAFYKMSIESAEMCKYVSNCFLATKISFSNEITSLAERVENINIDQVMESVMADHRICPSHLKPGLGFGGSCFPKDVRAILRYAENHGVGLEILSSVLDVNAKTTERLMFLLKRVVGEFDGRKVAILGLTFKAGTDDTRSSPSLELIRNLHTLGARISVHDPEANLETVPPETTKLFSFSRDIADSLQDSEILIIMTDWPMYKEQGLHKLTKTMKTKIVIDGRRMFVRSEIPQDVNYRAFGSY